MMKLSAAVIVMATSIVPALATDLDPCRLLTAAEIGSTLGGAPSGGKPDGPTIDEDLGAKAWSCNQQVGKLFFSINVAEFPSAAAAAQGMTLMMKQAKEIPEGIKLTGAPGLGDQAVWGASGDGAMWVTRKGKHMLNVTVAGRLTDPPRLREPLKRLATIALGRLVP
jgi:hypothetical protein